MFTMEKMDAKRSKSLVLYSESLNNEYIGRIKCRLDNFSMSFILYYVDFSNGENLQHSIIRK